MNGRSHQSNCDLVRYLDWFIKIDFSGGRKDFGGGGQFHVKRGLFAATGTPATNSGRRLHTLEEV